LALAIGASSAAMAMESVEIRMGSGLRGQVELAGGQEGSAVSKTRRFPQNADFKTSNVGRMFELTHL
jgi:hypothetical protein